MSLGDVMSSVLLAEEGADLAQLPVLMQSVVRPLALLGTKSCAANLSFPTLLGQEAIFQKRRRELTEVRREKLGFGLPASKRAMLFVP